MRDYQSIGPVPCAEDCQQIGSPDYDDDKARLECKTYIAQLKRMHKNIPFAASFGLKSFPHDFGTYTEVVVNFDDEYEDSVNFMLEVECNLPEDWDDESKKALGIS